MCWLPKIETFVSREIKITSSFEKQNKSILSTLTLISRFFVHENIASLVRT